MVDPCDPAAVVDLARRSSVDLVVIGPEAPLVAGVADTLRAAEFAVFGPDAAAAQLEASKGFTKDLCRANGIPTGDYVRVERTADALAALDGFGIPVVIKADGLAAGKGVTVAMSREEAETAILTAGDGPLVVEEFLDGCRVHPAAELDHVYVRKRRDRRLCQHMLAAEVGVQLGGLERRDLDEVLTPRRHHL